MVEVDAGSDVNGTVLMSTEAGAKTKVDISGSLTTDTTRDAVLTYNYGGESDLSINNGVSNSSGNGLSSSAIGENAVTNITINGGLTAEKEMTGVNQIIGISLTAGDAGKEKLVFENGDIIVKATYNNTDEASLPIVEGMILGNAGGELEVVGNSNIIATGGKSCIGMEIGSNGIAEYVPDESAEPIMIDSDDVVFIGAVGVEGNETELYLFNNEFYILAGENQYQKARARLVTEEGSTKVAITGDVTGDQYGIRFTVDDIQTADVLVDGTVSGEKAGIVIQSLQKPGAVGDNVKITAWQIKPNKDGAVATRYIDYADHSEEVEDAEAEKAIQYIIRVDAEQKDIISAIGTIDYAAGGKTYKVAKEGDTVTLKLNLPEGKEIASAFWDESQSDACKLLQDADGNYYLQVPRGGGVWLSVVLQDITKKEEKQEEKPEDTPVSNTEYAYVPASVPEKKVGEVTTLLKIRDKTDNTEITFFSNGTYKATYEDGSFEMGKLKLKEDELVLINDNDTEKNEIPVTFNEEKDVYEMDFIPTAEMKKETPKTFAFEIHKEDVETLKQNRKWN